MRVARAVATAAGQLVESPAADSPRRLLEARVDLKLAVPRVAPPPSPYMATSWAYTKLLRKRERKRERDRKREEEARERERVKKKRETIIITACPARVDHARDLAAGTRRHDWSLLQKQSTKAKRFTLTKLKWKYLFISRSNQKKK